MGFTGYVVYALGMGHDLRYVHGNISKIFFGSGIGATPNGPVGIDGKQFLFAISTESSCPSDVTLELAIDIFHELVGKPRPCIVLLDLLVHSQKPLVLIAVVGENIWVLSSIAVIGQTF